MPNVGADTAKGALGGAATGAAIGSFLGPVGTGVGAIAGALIGGIGANKASKGMQSALQRIGEIPMVDPTQLAFKDRLARESRALASGLTTDFQVAKDILRSTQAGSFSVAAKVGAGNPALAMTMMREGERSMNVGLNQALGTISTRTMGYTEMMGDMVDKIAKRKLDLEVYKANVGLGQSAAEYKDVMDQSNAVIGQGMAALPGYVDSFKAAAAGETNWWGTQIK